MNSPRLTHASLFLEDALVSTKGIDCYSYGTSILSTSSAHARRTRKSCYLLNRTHEKLGHCDEQGISITYGWNIAEGKGEGGHDCLREMGWDCDSSHGHCFPRDPCDQRDASRVEADPCGKGKLGCSYKSRDIFLKTSSGIPGVVGDENHDAMNARSTRRKTMTERVLGTPIAPAIDPFWT